MNSKSVKTEYADEIMFLIEDIGFGKNTIVLVMEFESRIDPERLKESLAVMMDRHPVMGCRFVKSHPKPFWEKTDKQASDLIKTTESRQEFIRFRNTPVDPVEGPVISACLLNAPEGASLIMKCHHSFCDVGGIKEFAYQVSDVYMKTGMNPRSCGNPDASHDRSLDGVIREIPYRAYPEIVLNGLRELAGNSIPFKSVTLPIGGDRKSCGHDFYIRHIGREDFEKLAGYGRKSGATVNDMLMAAFLRSVSEMAVTRPFSAFRTIMTVDLRLWSPGGQRHGGVFNMSSFEFVNIGSSPGKTFDETLTKVRDYTSKRKKSWYGFNQVLIINYIYRLFSFKHWAALGRIAIWLGFKTGNIPNGISNYGMIDTGRVIFGGRPKMAYILPPVVRPPAFSVSASSYGGTLTLSTGIFGDDPLVKGFIDRMTEHLTNLHHS